jgi:hypothetical protein
MPAPSGWIHTATFLFYAHAGTTNRIRPEDMGLVNYWFGIRYKNPANNYWYYKTTTQRLNYKQNEALAQAIVIDVAYAGPGQFVNAPFGIGRVYYELIVCDSEIPEWTTSPPSEVIKLPDVTIGGVHYINSGSFLVSHWLNATNLSMLFANSGAPYQSSIITTSDSEWIIYYKPSWLTVGAYRGGTLITGYNPYLSGDELRAVPNSVPNDNLIGTIQVRCKNYPTISKIIDVMQEGSSPSSSYFFNDYDPFGLVIDPSSYAILISNATSHLIRWKATSGIGSGNTTVWIRLWCTTHSLGSSWIELSTQNGLWNNTWITTSNTLIHTGGYYSIDISKVNPLI